MKEYKHELRKEVRSIAGGYELEKEGTLEMDGKEVLYVVGNAVVDSSCCGFGGCRYALVPGYVEAFKARRDGHGQWISRVEPIMDRAIRQEITRVLMEEELVQQVQF